MQKFPIVLNDANQRLDKFLKKLFPNATLSYLYKLNRKGNIKIITGGKKTKQDNEYKLLLGDEVHVFLSDTDIQDISQPVKEDKAYISDTLSKQDIIHEDKSILVINKNPGQNVHPGDHKTQEVSLIEQVQDYLGDQLSSLTFKPSLVHRIDRDTSGLIIIAKDKQSLSSLTADFKKKNSIKKTYYAIVIGKLSRMSGTITKKIKRVEGAQRENKIQISESGQEAITHYKLIDQYILKIPQGEQCISCVEVVIETGRMHQIRIHMAALGNPILGDKTYGNVKLNGYFAKNFGITRQMLHAWKIGFIHPYTHKKSNLEARLKKDMMDFIRQLKK